MTGWVRSSAAWGTICATNLLTIVRRHRAVPRTYAKARASGDRLNQECTACGCRPRRRVIRVELRSESCGVPRLFVGSPTVNVLTMPLRRPTTCASRARRLFQSPRLELLSPRWPRERCSGRCCAAGSGPRHVRPSIACGCCCPRRHATWRGRLQCKERGPSGTSPSTLAGAGPFHAVVGVHVRVSGRARPCCGDRSSYW